MYLVFVCFLWSLFNVSKLYHSHLKAISCHFVSIFVTKQKPQNDMKQMLCGCSLQHWGCILKIVFFLVMTLRKRQRMQQISNTCLCYNLVIHFSLFTYLLALLDCDKSPQNQQTYHRPNF